MSTFSNTAREVEMPNGDIVKFHDAVTPNSTSNIKKFKYDDNGHVTESEAADAEDLNLSGYSTPTTGTTAIGASDDVQTAIGKLDHQSQIDQTNILYGLNTGVKNLLIITPTATINGLTSVQQSDGYTVKITGTPTGGKSIRWSDVMKITESGTYKVKLTLSGTSASCYLYDVTTSTVVHEYYSSNTYNETLTANHEYAMYTYSSSAVDATISAMLCTAAAYAQSADFMPPALPNVDLTVREAEDRAALVDVVDNGVKNLLDLANVTDTDNNVTVSKSNSGFSIASTDQYAFHALILTMQAGVYYLSADISALSGSNNCSVYVRKDNVSGDYIGYQRILENGKIVIRFTVDQTRTIAISFYASDRTYIDTTTYTVSNLMICPKLEYEISPSYQPYALPNSDLTRMVSDLQKKAVKVYSYHVNPTESDPEDAVTYLDDAAGLTPAKMGASSFSYGSWANAWFLPRPCVLKFDGTVDYYLNPNDYSKKTDGTYATITQNNTTGNVMLEFPKIWVKRVNDGNGARTVSIAPVNVDGTYKCWSNINAEDKEVDHFYLPAYNGTIHSSKMRSLSGVTLNTTYAPNYTRAQEVTAATANNPTEKNLWYTETWADFCLIYDLLYLMGKSLDLQRTFGQGLSSGSETAMRAYVTGTHNAKGLFYGDISGTSTAVKVLGMENLWGCRWHGVAGLINDNGTLKVKMTYGVADGSTTVGYNTTGSGYLTYGSTYGTNGFVKKMQADNTMGYKIIETAGTDATYYCDYYYTNNGISAYALLGGYSAYGADCGFFVSLGDGAAYAGWAVGGSLSCRP